MITLYIICFGTTVTRTGYIDVIAGALTMSAANFIIIFSVCRIQSTINKLPLVFL